jgi:hypothetical protein
VYFQVVKVLPAANPVLKARTQVHNKTDVTAVVSSKSNHVGNKLCLQSESKSSVCTGPLIVAWLKVIS